MIRSLLALSCTLLPTLAAATTTLPPAWQGYAANAQHSAAAPARPQNLASIHWQTPVDLMPQLNGSELLIHYASPMITGANSVITPVKTGAGGGWNLSAFAGATGTPLWSQPSDYVLPPSGWTPSFPATLTATTLYYAGAGGTVMARTNPDAATGTTTRLAFYGLTKFGRYTAAFTANVMVDTPLTTDPAGNLFFGFVVLGKNPAKLTSGIARIGATGKGAWVSAASLVPGMTQVAMNCAPALSPDGGTVYITLSNGSAGTLVGLDSTTLALKYQAPLIDPASGQAAWVTDISSASPTIGPDGDVFYGVLENPFPSHNDRGWLLHFDATLATLKTPGSFGWDDTVSVVPTSAVPGYSTISPYLLMTKYNNYSGIGSGDGRNRIAILDPENTEADPINPTVASMKEAETVVGPVKFPGGPKGATYEWCINSAVVDRFTNAVFAGSEDGYMYRWDLATGKITQKILLNSPRPEAYTPSVVGPDGTVYSINNATLYALGK